MTGLVAPAGGGRFLSREERRQEVRSRPRRPRAPPPVHALDLRWPDTDVSVVVTSLLPHSATRGGRGGVHRREIPRLASLVKRADAGAPRRHWHWHWHCGKQAFGECRKVEKELRREERTLRQAEADRAHLATLVQSLVSQVRPTGPAFPPAGRPAHGPGPALTAPDPRARRRSRTWNSTGTRGTRSLSGRRSR